MAAISFEHADDARTALRAIVSDPAHGGDALSIPPIMSNLLQDLLPDAPREASLIMAAANAGLPEALREHVAHGMGVETAIGLTASTLAARTAFSPAACAWVATELAIALGLASPGVVVVVPSPGEADTGQADTGQADTGQADTGRASPLEASTEQANGPAAGTAPATEVSAHVGTPALAQAQLRPEAPVQAQAQDRTGRVGQVVTTAPISAKPVGAPSRRIGPAALVGASIVVAGAVVAGAIVLGSKSGTGAAHHGRSEPPSSGGSSSASTSPPVSKGPSSPGYHLTATLNPGTQGTMSQVAWTPDSKVVATSDQNGSVYLWDPATGRLHGRPLTVPGAGKAFATAISPDGSTLAVGFKNGSTYLWNIASGQLTATLPDPGPAAGKEVDSVTFSPDGSTLVSADGNGRAFVWRISPAHQSSTPVMTLPDPAGAGVLSVAFSGGGTLATGDYSGNIYLWNPGSGTASGSLVIPGGLAVTALAFSPDRSVLAAGSGPLNPGCGGRGSMYLFSTVSQASQFIASPGPAWAMAFHGKTLAAADGNGQTYLWNVNTASLTVTAAGTLPDPNSGCEGVGALDFSPDGRWLVTGDTNGRAYVWTSG